MNLMKVFKNMLLSVAFLSVVVLSIAWANNSMSHSQFKAQAQTIIASGY